MIFKTGKATLGSPGTAVQISATSLIAQRVHLSMDSSALGLNFAGDASVKATAGSQQGALIPTASSSLSTLTIEGPIDISRIYFDGEGSGNVCGWTAVIA